MSDKPAGQDGSQGAGGAHDHRTSQGEVHAHKKVLVLFAHPNARGSRAGRVMKEAVETLPGVTLRDLYGVYPDFLIDVKKEQALLEEHDLIVFQHPFYWYASPPLLKLWLDEVLTHGWAYGDGGTRLHGKTLWSVLTTGGPSESYSNEGYNRFPMETFLAPFDQTANLCGMAYPKPHIVHGVFRLDDVELAGAAEIYRQRMLNFITHGEGP